MRDSPDHRELLDWYDINARVLPWRVSPADRKAGASPDPYRVWLSEIMLQQTTVAAVKTYYLRFLELWPTVQDLAQADDASVMAEWAGLGYYARARNLLKCARIISERHAGVFPASRKELLSLPGIGPYTASAIASIAFDKPETVVDGNVERVMSRLFEVQTPLPKAKAELTKLADALTPSERAGDYAQAVMDLGATICTPKAPACGICPWMGNCLARKNGTAADLPRKAPKKPKPIRLGVVYLAQRSDGAWLLETRPDHGLLGGMLGWPGSDWAETPPEEAPPVSTQWNDLGTEVRHTFTHFHLRLRVLTARVDRNATPSRGTFLLPDQFKATDLPTVMRKAFNLVTGGDHTIDGQAA